MIISRIEETEKNEKVIINGAYDLVPLLKEFYRTNKDKENFVVVALNTNSEVISIRTVSVGTINASLVHSREVFRFAILENANSIILSHNHPSGNLQPSNEDISTTRKLKQSAEIIGIPILDHIIIGDGYYSFVQNDIF